jgi:hypothetical protein
MASTLIATNYFFGNDEVGEMTRKEEGKIACHHKKIQITVTVKAWRAQVIVYNKIVAIWFFKFYHY